jgi:hypothetical protein
VHGIIHDGGLAETQRQRVRSYAVALTMLVRPGHYQHLVS